MLRTALSEEDFATLARLTSVSRVQSSSFSSSPLSLLLFSLLLLSLSLVAVTNTRLDVLTLIMPVPSIIIHPPSASKCHVREVMRMRTPVQNLADRVMGTFGLRPRSISTPERPSEPYPYPPCSDEDDLLSVTSKPRLPRVRRQTVATETPLLPPITLIGTELPDFEQFQVNPGKHMKRMRTLAFLDLSPPRRSPPPKKDLTGVATPFDTPVGTPRSTIKRSAAKDERRAVRVFLQDDTPLIVSTCRKSYALTSPDDLQLNDLPPSDLPSDDLPSDPSSSGTPPRCESPSPYRRPRSALSMHTIRRKPVPRKLFDYLNGTQYPNIVDRILSEIPPGQLAPLRRVCIELRNWVDLFLCFHVIIETYGGQDVSHVKLTVTRHLGPRHVTVLERSIWDDEPIETISPQWFSSRILSRTRCLELRGPLGRINVVELEQCLLNLQTVRLAENGLGLFPDSCPFVAENIVATLMHDPHYEQRRGSLDGDTRWHLPEGVKRVFLNIRLDGRNPTGRVRPFSYPSTLRNVVIRFVGQVPKTVYPGVFHHRPLDLIFRQIGSHGAHVKYTFIDVANFDLLWLAPPTVPKEPAKSPLRRLVKLTRKRRNSVNKVRPISHISHISHVSTPSEPSMGVTRLNRRQAEFLLLTHIRECLESQQKLSASVDTDILKRVTCLTTQEYAAKVSPVQYLTETAE